MYRHLDHSSGYFAKVKFVDFSSHAFNTILSHILIDKICDYGINFLLDFLTSKVQKVFINGVFSIKGYLQLMYALHKVV
ncbi:hypothetical protein HOLleu_02476 [Holothuria leucospilota]|uniref:Uncharacterized protein n=1 Tax=Holothuria leucospilota TaxID=206669 RepID=A0A9Q1CRT6_HOLLE|nr:hypothetical protein HOLleu_02476 [Holothuria leucospilota]